MQTKTFDPTAIALLPFPEWTYLWRALPKSAPASRRYLEEELDRVLAEADGLGSILDWRNTFQSLCTDRFLFVQEGAEPIELPAFNGDALAAVYATMSGVRVTQVRAGAWLVTMP